MNYGLPYKGSKNKLAEKINDLFPKAENFYDLFCGGCAVTHRALIENRFKSYVINDINPMCTDLFVDAINGKFQKEKRWISREDFQNSKEPYVRFCWSFGNNLKNYLYSQKIEPYKKACHYAIVFDDFSLFSKLCPEVLEATKEALKDIKDIKQRRLKFGPAIIKKLKELNDWNLVQNNELYKSAHWRGGKLDGKHNDLERLQSLESLERLESLQSFNKSYDEIKIKENSVIYCDIPYKGTDEYLTGFHHEKFYDWCRKQKELVLISSYEMPHDFVCISAFTHQCTLGFGTNSKVTEKVFIPAHQLELWKEKKLTNNNLELFDFEDL